jgi:hypothetical protein
MRRWFRSILAFCSFAVALSVTARLLNEVKLFQEVPMIRDKWAFYQKHKNEYDTLLIGSSRTYRGIMPGLFDRLTAEAGVPTRTFNFGIDGMFPPEDAYVAERMLRNPPKNLRWVFFEVGLFVDHFEGRHPAAVRTIHWHDLERTVLSTRSRLWPKNKPEKMKHWFRSEKGRVPPISDCLLHWRLFFVKTLNLGRGSEFLGDYFLKRHGKGEAVGPTNDGFLPMAPDRMLKGEELAAYERDIKKYTNKPARVRPLPIYGQENLATVADRVHELGAQMIVFISPTTGSRREYPDEELALPMIDLRMPYEYPELFDPAVRADPSHVNARGAELMTRRIAEGFVKVARSQGPGKTQSPSPSR